MRSKAPTAELAPILDDLNARGLGAFVEIDYAIVRGLAYYTGVVFEVFDRSKNERALAGGGRYDKLLSLMSDGKVDLPALGFGMGDVVLANLIDDTPAAKAQMDAWLARTSRVRRLRRHREGGTPHRCARARSSACATPASATDFPLTAGEGRQTISNRRTTRRAAAPSSSATNGRR